MRYEIHGTIMQSLDVHLNRGESIYTESGGMAWMKGKVSMETNTKGGLIKGLGRMLTGESFFMTTYASKDDDGLVVFTPKVPGKVVPIDLAGKTLVCQKDAFMCADSSVTLAMHLKKKLATSMFGGEGFILLKVTGPGTVFFEIPGEVREYTLGVGESMRIDPGHIAIFELPVKYDIQQVKGLKNMFFAGEGLFLATLTGPGKIWLQTMPLSNLAGKLLKYLPIKNDK